MASATAQRAADLNFSDVPEMLPGAWPGANPARRREFERRSYMLYQEDEAECAEEVVAVSRAAAAVALKDLEEMFPTLDPVLIRTLHTEAPSAQHAIETLLSLSASSAEPVSRAASSSAAAGEAGTEHLAPQWELGVQDHDKFPSLVDSDGWQVLPSVRLQAEDEEPGSAWCDCAKAVAKKPAPKRNSQTAVIWGPKKKQSVEQKEEEEDQARPFTDYECRHRAGEQRAKHRVQYGRGRVRCIGPTVHGTGSGCSRGGQKCHESGGEEFAPSDV